VLWSFSSANDDGEFPSSNLVADNWGNLYGTTTNGGSISCIQGFSGCGTIFELSPPIFQQRPWRERILWSFGGPSSSDGAEPDGLIAGQWGRLYGTTGSGGATSSYCSDPFGCGTVFEFSLY
jgi:hypothetical protein